MIASSSAGVDALIDASNTSATDPAQVRDFFTTVTRTVLAAEQRAGVRHHVLLSIVGIDREQRNFHYAGKRAQEELVVKGPARVGRPSGKVGLRLSQLRPGTWCPSCPPMSVAF